MQTTDDDALAGFDAIGDLAGFPVGIVIADAFHAPTGAAMDVADVAGALSPVPGGVGPLTIAMLLRNTLRAAEELVK